MSDRSLSSLADAHSGIGGRAGAHAGGVYQKYERFWQRCILFVQQNAEHLRKLQRCDSILGREKKHAAIGYQFCIVLFSQIGTVAYGIPLHKTAPPCRDRIYGSTFHQPVTGLAVSTTQASVAQPCEDGIGDISFPPVLRLHLYDAAPHCRTRRKVVC